MIAFASVDPMCGKAAVDEAKCLIAAGGIRGIKLHPPLQQFHPNDKNVYPFYEVINAAKLPVIFHTGHSGIGTGQPGGGGVRLKYGNPMDIDDVAVDFPDMLIIMAHPSFPWQDEAISVCLHKPQVYIDLSGWSPKYFSPTLVQYANTLLKHKVLFGSDYPLIAPDRWLADFEKIAIIAVFRCMRPARCQQYSTTVGRHCTRSLPLAVLYRRDGRTRLKIAIRTKCAR